MSATSTTGLLLDGVFASEAIDSSGEILDIKGMDISLFDEGKGLANYEHKDSSGDSNGQEIVGKIVFARKIFNEDDCQDERQKMFWRRTKLPFLYGIVRLYDAAGHDGAAALAASIRDSVANDEPIVVGFSIEGSTLEKKGNKLASTIARLVALTTKPCNKQAVSGILADPNAPPGFDKNPEKAKTTFKNIVDPLNMRLGGSETEYGAEMLKALTAGSYNGAPGSLTGGAALQREDRTLKAMAMAAKRDWPKTGKFRDFLKTTLEKANLPDVSDEFLDHYSDLVEADHYRVKKSEQVIEELKKAGKLPKKPGSTAAAPKTPALTNNGVPVKPNKKLTEPKFDENSGILHMPEGSFKVYVPSHDPNPAIGEKFHSIMNDPKVDEFHNYAMSNWAKAHQLFKAGKTPPEVSMHAVLFSNLSPNTPVPMQEMMYGHLVDSMKATGQTPLTPGWEGVKNDWLERDQPQKFPDHSPEHWKRLESALRLKHDSKTTGRTKGDIGSFMLANDKFENMTKYAKMHAPLQELLQRHKGDARSAVEEMMYHKNEQGKWNNRRRIALGAGKSDPGEYPGMSIAGLAPKTARYALAMMGGGNIHVPDTHFTRNLFGLNRNLDGNSIAAIKNVMWNEKNSHILNGIDRYYAKNHDAVKHMLQHPQWGSLFKNPEDAVFPAFWKHWMAIVPHEQARGHTVNGYNELTDHKPFWEAIAPHMKKNESVSDLPLQTAKQHAEWQLQYGEIPAMLLYYRHLLPQLLAAGGQREAQALVRKAQELQVEVLSKGDRTDISHAHDIGNRVQELDATHGLLEGEKNSDYAGGVADREGLRDQPITFQNRRVRTGIGIDVNKGRGYHLLGASASHFFAIPDSIVPHKGWSDQDLVKIPRNQHGFEVSRYPESVDEPSVVNADLHGVGEYVKHPGSRALAHGFNFASKTRDADDGAAQASSFWAKDPRGRHVYVKANAQNWMSYGHNDGPWNTARREGVYHNMAHDFFGLGKYVPDVAVVAHPQTGREHALIQHVPGRDAESTDDKTLIGAFRKTGNDIQKIALMNTIMGNADRHEGNWMVNKDGIKLIDHNLIGTTKDRPMFPTYLHYGDPQSPKASFADHRMTPETHSWVKSLKRDELRNQLMKHGMPQQSIDYALARLEYLQDHGHTDSTLERAIDNANRAYVGARRID